MKNYLEIGSTPCDEPCAQVGQADYYIQARRECRAFVAQLRRQFGHEPVGAALQIKSFPHDFGQYYDVVIIYNEDSQLAVEYAYDIEAHPPQHWDDEAKEALGLIRRVPQL